MFSNRLNHVIDNKTAIRLIMIVNDDSEYDKRISINWFQHNN